MNLDNIVLKKIVDSTTFCKTFQTFDDVYLGSKTIF